VNKVLHPTFELKSKTDIEKFINIKDEFDESIQNKNFFWNGNVPIGDWWRDMPKKTRVIAFFRDKKEYINEYRLV
jgi:hypothetical protein